MADAPGPAEPVRPSNTRDLTTISLAFFLAFLGPGACQPFVVSYLNEIKGLSLAEASCVLSVVYFTFTVFRFLVGFLIDAVGLHRAKILGIATYAVFPFVIWRAESLPLFLAGSVLWGIGAPMLWTSSLVQILNVTPATRYATAAGIVRGTVMFAVFLGAFFLPLLYARYGYAALFGAATALGVAAIVAMTASPSRPVEREKPDLRKFLTVMANHDAKVVAGFLICSGLAYGILLNGFKSHIEIHCGKDWLKIILPVFCLTGILANFLGGRVCDRIGRWPTFAWGFAAGAVGLGVAWTSNHHAAIIVALMMIGVQFALVPLSAFAWIGDRTTPADRASVMGYVFCFRDLGVALAIQLGGLIATPAPTFLVFAVVWILCAAVAVTVSRWAGRDSGA